MVKVAIRYVVDEKPDVAVEAEYPNGLTEEQAHFLMDTFISLIKIRRGDVAASPQPTVSPQPQTTPGCEPR